MRLPCILSLLLLLPAAPDGVWAAERTELHLFQYGRANSDRLKIAFLDFRDLLLEKMPKLAVEVQRESIIEPLDRLALKQIKLPDGSLETADVKVGNVDKRRKYWLETGALGVLTGYVREDDGRPWVHTSFFWGTLRGPWGTETIDLVLPVDGAAFDTTNDSHSVATLYALAQQIGEDCARDQDGFRLLSEAAKRAQAVTMDLYELGAKLQDLVHLAIEELKERCHD